MQWIIIIYFSLTTMKTVAQEEIICPKYTAAKWKNQAQNLSGLVCEKFLNYIKHSSQPLCYAASLIRVTWVCHAPSSTIYFSIHSNFFPYHLSNPFKGPHTTNSQTHQSHFKLLCHDFSAALNTLNTKAMNSLLASPSSLWYPFLVYLSTVQRKFLWWWNVLWMC